MEEKKIRALFITHTTSNYGASRSLQLLLNNYRDARIDLVVWKNFPSSMDAADLRARFGARIETIREHILPFDYGYKGKPEKFVEHAVRSVRNRLFWQLGQGSLYRTIREGGYDLIHLNSLVLHPIIREEFPFVIHVREISDAVNRGAAESLCRAHGVVFIDEATREPFRHLPLRNSIVLNNPVDMSPLRDYSSRELGPRYEALREATVFSVIGVIAENKGTDFIIRSFMATANDRARLLIVGRGEKSYENFCRGLAGNDDRIIFWGEEPDILKVYFVSDYIVRGEAYQCVGRTIYEGLYAGCQVVVPAVELDETSLFEYERFRQSIHPYRPRDGSGLTGLFARLAGCKVENRVFQSNVGEYVARFHEFVSRAVGLTRS